MGLAMRAKTGDIVVLKLNVDASEVDYEFIDHHDGAKALYELATSRTGIIFNPSWFAPTDVS